MKAMKLLNGAELAEYVKERQAKQVRGLRQAWNVFPKLVIIQTDDNPVIDAYIRLKKRYGEDILIDVEYFKGNEDEALGRIKELNEDPLVHGIIVQLPLGDASRTDELLQAVAAEKDVDALGKAPVFDAATPTAISWLLAGYNVDLNNKQIAIIGHGRLVGAPLAKMWQNSGYNLTVIDETTDNAAELIRQADVIVSAVGKPGLITSDMVRPEAVIVDAGTSSEGGKVVGDVASDVRERHDITITPEKGGVGPLTVAALFDNVIRAARATIPPQEL